MSLSRQSNDAKLISQMSGGSRTVWILVICLIMSGWFSAISSTLEITNMPLPDLDLSPGTGPDSSNELLVLSVDGSNQTVIARSSLSDSAVMPTNTLGVAPAKRATAINPFQRRLTMARYLRKMRQFGKAQKMLVALLGNGSPDAVKKSALLELAAMAQDQDDLSRAQDVYAQFLDRWPDDPRVPEILLRQGQIFRKMGLSTMALNKFYAVMTTALTLKDSHLKLYKQLVLQAQVEIADTHYDLGKYADASEFYSRLYKQANPDLDKPQILYRLICCENDTSNYDQAAANGQSFLKLYPGAPQEPEVRFHVAQALNHLGRHNDALLQVLALLKEQSSRSQVHPETWAYWRQRAGNLIGNQFYQEGDYTRALNIYTSLARLDSSPQWELPVWYQMGLTYEHLWQPQKATAIYKQIINRDQQLGTNAPPSLATIANMAQWRLGFVHWQNHAENVNRDLHKLNAAIAELQPSTNSIP